MVHSISGLVPNLDTLSSVCSAVCPENVYIRNGFSKSRDIDMFISYLFFNFFFLLFILKMKTGLIEVF